MFRYMIHSGIVVAAAAILLAGCASTGTTNAPTTPAVSQPATSTQPSPAPTDVTTSAGSPTAGPTANNTSGGTTSGDATASPNGTITLVVVPSKSQARYRVTEQLAGLSLPDDAVGSTNSFTGTIVGKMDGTIVSSQSKFVVDLRTLKSDQSMRDGFIQRTPLQTSQYPYATFVPTSATGLPTAVPSSGQAAFKLVGDLTIKDVTKPVTWNVTCQIQSSQTEGTCNATTNFTFEDFNLTQPKIGRVLSIVDKITLEVDVDLQLSNS